MTIALITPPASEPVTLIDVKAHLRIDHDHEDALLLETIKAARQYTELSCGQKLITQTWRQYESGFSIDGAVVLKLSPVQNVLSVTMFDRDGNPSALPTEDFQFLREDIGTVLKVTGALNSTLADNGLEIDVVAGMGDFGVDVADTLKRAILLLVAHWYEFRGAIPPSQQPVSVPPGFDALIQPYRRVNL